MSKAIVVRLSREAYTAEAKSLSSVQTVQRADPVAERMGWSDVNELFDTLVGPHRTFPFRSSEAR